MCHCPVYEGNVRQTERRVERRSEISGRTRGFAFLREWQHVDCSITPEAKNAKVDEVAHALRLAGVEDDPRARALLRELGEI